MARSRTCCHLNFELENQPKWRKSGPSTKEMIEGIVTFRDKFEKLKPIDQEFCRESFSSAMAVEFIYYSNIGELVGSQTKEGTEELIKSILEKRASGGSDQHKYSDREATETLNTYAAMKKLYQIFKDEMHGFLTVQQICDVHRVLMEGLHDTAGEIRKTEVYAIWEGNPHFYPHPLDVEDKFYALVDRHYIYVDQLSKIKNSKEEVEHVFKCAARLLFDFVDTHPFGDGNGRMCRLLANYVLTLITPFPVGLYHTDNKNRSGRKDYVDAIIQCRENPKEGPRDLAALLVEGAWNGWKTLFKNLASRDSNLLGPIVVQASKLEKIDKNVERVLGGRKLELNRAGVTKCIIKHVKEMNIDSLEECQYLESTIEVAPQTNIVLNVFK